MGRRQNAGAPVNGWVILDKPVGPSSTQALAKVRRLFQADKAGHAGTLDPLASGILPIALGEATKTIPFIQDGAKCYDFTLGFGAATTTDDLEGSITETSDIRPSNDQLIDAFRQFVGPILQRPPVFSAIHVDGERAYDLARRGDLVELPERPVTIDRIELIDRIDADHALIRAACGKGTYIRSLARDLAKACGTLGHVVTLRRISVGSFGLNRAIGLEILAQLDYKPRVDQALHPVQTALDDIPAVAVTGLEEFRLRRGLPIVPGERQAFSVVGTAKAMGPDGLIALLEVSMMQARPVRVFNL